MKFGISMYENLYGEIFRSKRGGGGTAGVPKIHKNSLINCRYEDFPLLIVTCLPNIFNLPFWVFWQFRCLLLANQWRCWNWRKQPTFQTDLATMKPAFSPNAWAGTINELPYQAGHFHTEKFEATNYYIISFWVFQKNSLFSVISFFRPF